MKGITFAQQFIPMVLDGRKTVTRRLFKNIGIAPGIGNVCKHGELLEVTK